MTVNEALMKLGRWGFKLTAETPREVLDAIDYFGHVAISTGRVDPRVAGDSLLRSARYVGVVRVRQLAEVDSGAESTLGGPGMAMWLGDEDKKGSVLENATPFASGSFTSTVRALLPYSGAVTEGTLHSVTGAYTNTHVYQDPRTAIDYVCGYFTADTSDPVEWRVNGDGTLDAGHVSDLYESTPRCAIVRRSEGVDMALRALAGKASTARDVDDFTTRVVLLASGTGGSVATGDADIAPGLNGYLDLHGNPLVMTRLVSESATSGGNAAARAQLALNQFTKPRTQLTLSTNEYDVRGDVAVGDAVWVWSPDVGLEDQNNQIIHRGLRLHPVKLRLIEMTWPISSGMSVAYRDKTGRWWDLTDYVRFENGSTSLVVGGYDRSLTNSGGEPVGSRPVPDTSVPAAPVFVTPFVQAVYQSAISGITKAQVQVQWVKPNNTDGSLVLDGDHYEIQYRTGSTPIFPATHGQMSAYTHGQLAAGTHAQPITYEPGPWQSAYASFDDTAQLLQELTPGVPYDLRIRAFDNATPPNVSAWSATTTIQTNGDTIAPSTPAAPEVAASRIAVQITHTLGRSDGGEWNLEADLNHLEIHAQYTPSFFPDDTTRIGKLLANNGMMLGEIPAVGTFPVEFVDDVYIKIIAVDDAGNKSSPSVAAQSSVLLIDDAHISDLTVSKITAGTMTAQVVNAGRIWSGTDGGARMQLVAAGLEAYNASNTKTVAINASDGTIEAVGTITTGLTGKRIVLNPVDSGRVPEIRFFPDAGSSYGYINSPAAGSTATLGMNSGASGGFQTTVWLFPGDGRLSYSQVGTGTAAGGSCSVNSGGAHVENLSLATGQRNGGFLWALSSEAYFGVHYPGGVDAFHHVDGSNGRHGFKGALEQGNSYSGQAALWWNYTVAGGGAANFAYGATMTGTMIVLASWTDHTSYLKDTVCNVYNNASTGFSVGNSVGARNGHYGVQAMRFV
ncbi:hypothetical protein BBK82_03395 [Lentzea guizhouensis]|uniref:Fibronectin type-III domain-containing protein n=1 Tax=Lentzea guizhouensis TaxID=1586287 RepID=A0A1B2HC06_9PSEU|nr:hypothetical protein [Lentzea guizhouensis]ANZ35260.1 hypothetical protein BBK82_03395 [Lentzea guizhouensis]